MWKISLVYGGPSIPIKKKIKAKNKYKINKKINEMKLFFFKIKKGEKNTGFKKNPKNQMYIDSLLAKWQPQPNFQQKNPYRYKRTRREHLTSNQPLKFTRCHRGVKVVPNKGRLDAIAVSSYLWNHQILKHPKTTKKKKNGGVMNVCAASFVGNTCWKPTLASFAVWQSKTQPCAL